MGCDTKKWLLITNWAERPSVGVAVPDKITPIGVAAMLDEFQYQTMEKLNELCLPLVGTEHISEKKLLSVLHQAVYKAAGLTPPNAIQPEGVSTMSKVAIKKAVKKSTKPTVTAKTNGAARRGRKSKFTEDQKITILAKENPKREGSSSFKTFELYKKHKTVGAFLAAGGTAADLNWDSKHQFIRVSK